MKIKRLLLSQLQDTLIPGNILVLYGPRQVGKTTLAKDLLSKEIDCIEEHSGELDGYEFKWQNGEIRRGNP